MDNAQSKTDAASGGTPAASVRTGPGQRRHIDLTVGGMTCAHCSTTVEKAVRAVDGVVSVHVNLANRIAAIDYDPDRAAAIDLAKVIRAAGYTPGAATIRIPIRSMHCSSCVVRIELALQTTPGVLSAHASLGPNAVDVEYDPGKVDFDAIRRAIESAGHKVAEPKAADVKAAVEADTDPGQAASDER